MFRLIFLCCLSIGIAHAAPAPADTDDLEALINQSSVASEISQIGQRVGNQASELVVNAMGFLGVPYKRGGTGVSGGADGGDVAADHDGDIAGADLFPTYDFDVGCFHHCVRSFDHCDQSTCFYHAK